MKKLIAAALMIGLIPLISYSKTIGTYKGNICDYTLETTGGGTYQNKTYKNWVLKVDKFRPKKMKNEWGKIKIVVDSCKGEKTFEKTINNTWKKLADPEFEYIECPEDEQPKYSIYEDDELVATTDAVDNNVGDWSNGKKENSSIDRFIGTWVWENDLKDFNQTKVIYTIIISNENNKPSIKYCMKTDSEAWTDGSLTIGESHTYYCKNIDPKFETETLSFTYDIRDFGGTNPDDDNIRTENLKLSKNKKELIGQYGAKYKKQ